MKKAVAYIVGVLSVAIIALGLSMLFVSKTVAIILACVVICLSLATGLLLPNPYSFFGLVAGICMIIFSPKTVGIVFICIGTADAIVNFFITKRTLKS